jgi:hypothetical protein
MEAFAGRWEVQDARHRRDWEIFARREADLAGRVMNAARALPLTSLAEAWALGCGLSSGGAGARARGCAGPRAHKAGIAAAPLSLGAQQPSSGCVGADFR